MTLTTAIIAGAIYTAGFLVLAVFLCRHARKGSHNHGAEQVSDDDDSNHIGERFT